MTRPRHTPNPCSPAPRGLVPRGFAHGVVVLLSWAGVLLGSAVATAQGGPATTPSPNRGTSQAPATPRTPTSPALPPPVAAGADEVVIETELGEDTLHIADRTEIVLRVQHPASLEVEPVTLASVPAGRIQVLDIDQTSTALPGGSKDGRDQLTTITLTVHVLRVGRFYFAPMRVVLRDADGKRRVFAESQQVSLKVESVVLDELDEAKLRPVGGPRSLVEPDYRPLWAVGGGVAALVLLGFGFMMARSARRRAALRPEPPRPQRPAWDEAIAYLRALEAEPLPEGEVERREVYYRLSEVVREYLGRRFGFDSLEMTTSELLARISSLELPPKLDRPALEGLLLDCDLVKFARYRASQHEFDDAVHRAVAVVETTRPTPPPTRDDDSDDDATPPERPGAQRPAAQAEDAHPDAKWMPPVDYAPPAPSASLRSAPPPLWGEDTHASAGRNENSPGPSGRFAATSSNSPVAIQGGLPGAGRDEQPSASRDENSPPQGGDVAAGDRGGDMPDALKPGADHD